MEILIGIPIGIVLGIIANYLYDKIVQVMKEKPLLDIEGTWGEFVKDSEGHQFTLGQIYFDAQQDRYAFDGTNFNNDGSPFCHFETVTSYVDPERRKFFYVFNASLEGQSDQVYYGFGVVNLIRSSTGKLIPSDGHYVSDSIDGRGMAHTMKRFDQMEYARDLDGKVVVAALS